MQHLIFCMRPWKMLKYFRKSSFFFFLIFFIWNFPQCWRLFLTETWRCCRRRRRRHRQLLPTLNTLRSTLREVQVKEFFVRREFNLFRVAFLCWKIWFIIHLVCALCCWYHLLNVQRVLYLCGWSILLVSAVNNSWGMCAPKKSRIFFSFLFTSTHTFRFGLMVYSSHFLTVTVGGLHSQTRMYLFTTWQISLTRAAGWLRWCCKCVIANGFLDKIFELKIKNVCTINKICLLEKEAKL